MDNFEDWAYENGLSRTKDEDGYFSKNTEFASKAWQHQQAKVDEYILVAETLDELYVKEVEKNRKLQKRVGDLEFQLKDWKQKSMPAMLNGMCGRCGKEPLQGIGSDKEDYALLHCFGCGANKYEWIGEQAFKGGGQ